MIYTHIAAALIAGALAFGGAWKVQDWRYGAKEAERLEEVARDRMRAEKNINAAAVGHEKDKAQIRTEFLVITETVEKVVREPYYAASDAPGCFDASGLHELAAALGAASTPSKSASAVR